MPEARQAAVAKAIADSGELQAARRERLIFAGLRILGYGFGVSYRHPQTVRNHRIVSQNVTKAPALRIIARPKP
jgi:hypothetical protein